MKDLEVGSVNHNDKLSQSTCILEAYVTQMKDVHLTANELINKTCLYLCWHMFCAGIQLH